MCKDTCKCAGKCLPPIDVPPRPTEAEFDTLPVFPAKLLDAVAEDE